MFQVEDYFSHPHFCFRIIGDSALNQLMESLPTLPPCELLDPADDQTLPHLIEVLEQRHRIRQMMTEQVNKTGTEPITITELQVLRDI